MSASCSTSYNFTDFTSFTISFPHSPSLITATATDASPPLVLAVFEPHSKSFADRFLHAGKSLSNSLTNKASQALGVSNKLELNKPKLRLVRSSGAANERWIINEQNEIESALKIGASNSGILLGLKASRLIDASEPGRLSVLNSRDLLALQPNRGFDALIQRVHNGKYLRVSPCCCGLEICELEHITDGCEVLFGVHPSAATDFLCRFRIEFAFSRFLHASVDPAIMEFEFQRALRETENRKRERMKEAKSLALRRARESRSVRLAERVEYKEIWNSQSSGAKRELSVWRPIVGSSQVYFGDVCVPAFRAPNNSQEERAAVAEMIEGQFVKPARFVLLWQKQRGRQPLFVWHPVPPSPDFVSLGHLFTCSADAPAPAQHSLYCVSRSLLCDQHASLSQEIWNDRGSGGTDGSVWRSPPPLNTAIVHAGSWEAPMGSSFNFRSGSAELDSAAVDSGDPDSAPISTELAASYSLVWSDKGSLAKENLAFWRPHLPSGFVSFGHCATDSYESPHHSALIARDHPAFQIPERFEIAFRFQRGAKKAVVWRPIPAFPDHIALGCLVSASSDELPSIQAIRTVDRRVLSPLGAHPRLLWIERSADLSNLNLVSVSKGLIKPEEKMESESAVWRSPTNTFLLSAPRSHSPAPECSLRLPLSDAERTGRTQALEQRTLALFTALLGALQYCTDQLNQSDYKQLGVLPSQAAILVRAVERVSEAAADPAASDHHTLTFSEAVRQRIASDRDRIELVHSAFRRHIFESLSSAGEISLAFERLEVYWPLIIKLGALKPSDHCERWKAAPPHAAINRPFSEAIFDSQIGNLIAAKFVAAIPKKRSNNEGDAEFEIDGFAFKPLPESKSSIVSGAFPEAEFNVGMQALRSLTSELAQLTDHCEYPAISWLFVERYSAYILSAFHSQLAPTELSASQVLTALKWVEAFRQLQDKVERRAQYEGVQFDVQSKAAEFDALIDRLMKRFEEASKERILVWINNILKNEDNAKPESVEDENGQNYLTTSGPADLFSTLNTLFDLNSQGLAGASLYRLVNMFAHVLQFYLACLRELILQKARPADYLIAQINNSTDYEQFTDQLQDHCYSSLDVFFSCRPSQMQQFDQLFDSIEDQFFEIALDALYKLVQLAVNQMADAQQFAQLYTPVWASEHSVLSAALAPLDEMLRRCFALFRRRAFLCDLLLECADALTGRLMSQLASKLASWKDAKRSLPAIAAALKADREELIQFFGHWGEKLESTKNADEIVRSLDLLSAADQILAAEEDFLSLHANALFQASQLFNSRVSKNPLRRFELQGFALFKALLNTRGVNKTTIAQLWPGKDAKEESKDAERESEREREPSAAAQLQVTVVSGSGLAVKDRNSSDPYVVLHVLDANDRRIAMRKTAVIQKSLNPRWNCEFEVFTSEITAEAAKLCFECWDDDLIGRDFMGEAMVSIADIRSKQFVQLQRNAGESQETGRAEAIHLDLDLKQKPGVENKGSNTVSGQIKVKIVLGNIEGTNTIAPKPVEQAPAIKSIAVGKAAQAAAPAPSIPDSVASDGKPALPDLRSPSLPRSDSSVPNSSSLELLEHFLFSRSQRTEASPLKFGTMTMRTKKKKERSKATENNATQDNQSDTKKKSKQQDCKVM